MNWIKAIHAKLVYPALHARGKIDDVGGGRLGVVFFVDWDRIRAAVLLRPSGQVPAAKPTAKGCDRSMMPEPYVRREWSCEEAAAVSVLDFCVALICCPCVYGAGCSRECGKRPSKPRSACDCSVWWCIGMLVPPLTGIAIRTRQADGFGCGASVLTAAESVALETCCCVCVGAPCAMNEYRLDEPINISELLLMHPDEFTVVDTQTNEYIAARTEQTVTSRPCPIGSSPETAGASLRPSTPTASIAHPFPTGSANDRRTPPPCADDATPA